MLSFVGLGTLMTAKHMQVPLLNLTELYTQKSGLSCPPLSPKVFSWKLGDVSTFVSHEDGRREDSAHFILPPSLLFSQLLVSECSGKGIRLWEGWGGSLGRPWGQA